MSYPNVLMIGGSGFIGRHIAAHLEEEPPSFCQRLVIPTRDFTRSRPVLALPKVELVEADVHDEATLHQLTEGMDAVINLVGILHSRPGTPYGPEFAHSHVELPRKIASACAANGVHRLLHMSALGAAPDAPSMYLRSKFDGEQQVQSQPGLEVTIFRPSVVFGEEDHFLNMFASLQRWLPLLPLAGGQARFQPVYVQDVAQAFVSALKNRATIGHIYELAGPHVYTLHELVQKAGAYSGHPRTVIDLPDPLAHLQAMVMEHMPGGPLISRDNLDSMKIDNVAHGQIAPELGVTPTSLEAVAPMYLSGHDSPSGHLEDLRAKR